MPLARYFLLVGGALLVVLLVAGAWLPSLPVGEQAETQRAKIRIHTEMRLPERVVFDTSMPAVTHPPRAGGSGDRRAKPAIPRRCRGQGATGIRALALIRREQVESGRYKAARI